MRLNADQCVVMQSVIGAFEFDDLVATSGRASEADGMHRDFGSAVAEAHHLDGKAIADFFGQFPFHVVRHAEHGSEAKARLDSLHHRGMAMAGHERAEAQVMVDVVVTIEIAKMRALSFFDKNWI